jgi:anti-sigma factor RsiW
MEHFSEQVWANFVRGTGSPAEAATVEAHLSGCAECVAMLHRWDEVKTIAACECMYTPPDPVVRMARLEFAALRRDDARAITAKLTFDTFAQPLLAGVRSMTATPRQVVYEADGLTVDLRFDRQRTSKEVHLIGQVLDKRLPRASSADAVVTLWTANGLPIVEVSTNSFGEFHLEFEEEDRLRLSIQAVGRPIVRIPLSDLRDVNEREDSSNAGNQ